MRTTLALACLSTSISYGQFTNMRMESNGETMTLTFGARLSAQVTVTDHPYSGEEISEQVQTLADGTHIRQTPSSRKLYRDMQGRTRTERELRMGASSARPFLLVEIRDPVAGFAYVLDDQNKVAHRQSLAPAVDRAMVPQRPAAPPMTVSSFASEKLAAEIIEGVQAEGRRTTQTIPLGEVGNDRPMVSTTESWYSRDLRATVLMKHSDPRMGDQTTRLTNISRTSPDPALFEAPAGYKVVDEKDSFSIMLKRQ